MRDSFSCYTELPVSHPWRRTSWRQPPLHHLQLHHIRLADCSVDEILQRSSFCGQTDTDWALDSESKLHLQVLWCPAEDLQVQDTNTSLISVVSMVAWQREQVNSYLQLSVGLRGGDVRSLSERLSAWTRLSHKHDMVDKDFLCVCGTNRVHWWESVCVSV